MYTNNRMFVGLWCLFLIFRTTDSACTLPDSIQNSDWTYTYGSTPRILTLSADTDTLSTTGELWVNAQGTFLNSYSCFTNLTLSDSETVVVLRSDSSYTDFGDIRYIYMCMKLTKVTDNLYYLHLLSDVDSTVFPAQRLHSPPSDVILSDTDPVCSTFCTYTTTPEVSSLQKVGTGDSLPNDIQLCEPCDQSCASTDGDDCTPNPCKHGGTCTDLVNDYRCNCKRGYIGKDCGKRKCHRMKRR